MNDITKRIDEILGFFVNPSYAKTSGESPAIQAELSILHNKVIDQIKNIKTMTGISNNKKVSKKAIEVVIKKEGLNKNWASLLKKHMKKYKGV